MKKVTVKINKRNLTGLVRKTSFNYSGGMFTSYGFIAINFSTDRNNTATFYESTQVSQNSWTNYPGFKIWNNANESWKKSDVLEWCEQNLMDNILRELQYDYPDINFELIGF